MSKNRVIVMIAALLVVLALVAVAKGRNGESEVDETTADEEASKS